MAKTKKKATVLTQKRFNELVANVAHEKYELLGDRTDHPYYYSKLDGSYIGEKNTMKNLLKIGVTEKIQSRIGASISVIGFNPTKKKWYGWSHRAILGFGIGDKSFQEPKTDSIPYKNGPKITTLAEAKKSALAFSNSVG